MHQSRVQDCTTLLRKIKAPPQRLYNSVDEVSVCTATNTLLLPTIVGANSAHLNKWLESRTPQQVVRVPLPSAHTKFTLKLGASSRTVYQLIFKVRA